MKRLLALVLASLLATAGLTGLVASPALAVGSYNNADIATQALSHVDENGGQCKYFVNQMVKAASSNTQSPSHYQSGWAALGTEVTSANVVKGDIIQITPAGSEAEDAKKTTAGDSAVENMMGSTSSTRLHTAIVVSNDGNGAFTVVDSNWGHQGTSGWVLDEVVRQRSFSPGTWASDSIVKFWRLGTVSSGTKDITFSLAHFLSLSDNMSSDPKTNT